MSDIRKRISNFIKESPALSRVYYAGKNLVNQVRMLLDFYDDYRRYCKYSHGWSGEDADTKAIKALLKTHHSIEKGLSIRGRRPGFGAANVKALIQKLNRYRESRGVDAYFTDAVAALVEYDSELKKDGLANPGLEEWLSTIKPLIDASGSGGSEEVSYDQIRAITDSVPKEFFLSRHSIRGFTGEKIPVEVFDDLRAIAAKSPSVCNRQGTQMYIFEEHEDVLKLQPGNRGFGHTASHAIVIAADLTTYSTSAERNQAWIDAGMYSMSVLLGIHALGYGGVPLAWPAKPKRDESIKKELGLSPHQSIVMFIAVGVVPDTFRAAIANRHDKSVYVAKET